MGCRELRLPRPEVMLSLPVMGHVLATPGGRLHDPAVLRAALVTEPSARPCMCLSGRLIRRQSTQSLTRGTFSSGRTGRE